MGTYTLALLTTIINMFIVLGRVIFYGKMYLDIVRFVLLFL